MTRFAFSRSLSSINLARIVGTICQDRPNLSLSHPHCTPSRSGGTPSSQRNPPREGLIKPICRCAGIGQSTVLWSEQMLDQTFPREPGTLAENEKFCGFGSPRLTPSSTTSFMVTSYLAYVWQSNCVWATGQIDAARSLLVRATGSCRIRYQ